MPEITIRNLIIDFPFEPYDIQKDYMEKVIECLQNKTNGVLESPTGTGKTLSLLCSSLAWLCGQKAIFQMKQINNENVKSDNFMLNLEAKLNLQIGSSWNELTPRPPKIVYASRTHSQLNQVMLELKKTAYRHVKVGILGSRDQLCIHPQVSKETNMGAKIHMCKILTSARNCIYYNDVEKKVKDSSLFQEDRLIDIEDLIKKGKQTKCCPYFASRELQNDADILFAPYNYLLDPKTRRAHDIKLHNDVIILDEGHNVEKVCEESSSSHISSTIVAVCINEITAIMKIFHEQVEQSSFTEINLPKDFTSEELIYLKTIFMLIEKAIDEIELTDKKSKTFPGSFIFTILEKAQITPTKINSLSDVLNKVCQFLLTVNNSQIHQRGSSLSKFLEFLEIVFNSLGSNQSTNNTDLNFKLYVEAEIAKPLKGNSTWNSTNAEAGGKILNFWCFNPGFGMKSLLEQGVHCIILTSGTLSPLAATISEIRIPINVQLSNKHIIKSNQISAVVVDRGPGNQELKCVYQNRTNQKYLMDLAQTCLNFYRVIPGGILVFFPSYPFLKSCVDYWQENGVWNKMAAVKSIFVEPQSKEELKLMIEEYYKMINERGASLFAVCRGKVSEGMDFADAKARAVIVIGLPYPPFNDPKVMLKREYLDCGKKKNISSLDGNEWYQLEAMRAVNQAVGRVIRHADDHGAIIFCDCRFSFPNNIKSLSQWLQTHIVSRLSFGQSLKLVSSFFKQWKDIPTKIFLENVNITSPCSSYQYSRVLPAQKLAPNISKSSKVDYTKLYEASTSKDNTNKCETLSMISTKRKSFLDDLENSNVIITNNNEKLDIYDEFHRSKNINENKYALQQSVKKRKITIMQTKSSDNLKKNESVNTTEYFDFKKYTTNLQKYLSAEQLKTFKEATKAYITTENCEQFILTLSQLFLTNKNDILLSLYKDIPHFLKSEEHKEQFWKSYNNNLNKFNVSN